MPRRRGWPHGFTSVEEMVRHPDVDAIFIVSANVAHCRETIAAAEAGETRHRREADGHERRRGRVHGRGVPPDTACG